MNFLEYDDRRDTSGFWSFSTVKCHQPTWTIILVRRRSGDFHKDVFGFDRPTAKVPSLTLQHNCVDSVSVGFRRVF